MTAVLKTIAAMAAARQERVFRVGIDESTGRWPTWLSEAVSDFEVVVRDRSYPCHFGRHALELGELFASWLTSGEDMVLLARDLAAFLDTSQAFPRRRMALAVFVEPESEQHSHKWYGEYFWSVLAGLRAVDDEPWPADIPVSPQDPRWEFSFHGVPMFVFAASPTHHLRRSRQLGAGLVLLFQPRNVFHGVEGGTPGGIIARKQIRSKLLKWDSAPLHPLIGDYADPASSEWKQYFLSEDGRPLYGSCPLDPAVSECLHELVGAQARRTPTATAVVAGSQVLDYQTLMAASDRVARELNAKGIGPDDRVGVLADRSADTVISLLAVLMAGAAYVPVDPASPEDRRAYMLQNADVKAVLTPRSGGAQPEVAGCRQERPGPSVRVRPDNLAYVIYTSGSTGQPKGVAVSHRQIVHSIRAQYAVERPWPEAFLMPISFAFDASAVGLYWTLTTGGCLVLPTDAEYRDPVRLRELIASYGVTHTDCTPSLYDLILGTDPGPLRSLRCVQVGGETCPAELAERHLRLLPGCVFENNYGPTETTIWAATTVLGSGLAGPGPDVPIGRPIPGASLHLLDPGLTPVRPGAPGEVFIGGAGVARGYINNPALTAAKFLPDPFSLGPGQRMYRTGDVARELPDGSYQFIGRHDTQVKISGYRIELGEIETALRSHPDVAEAVVDVRAAGGQTLVGYLRMTSGRNCSDTALISHVARLLPGYMVPRIYVRMASLPRTTSGKVDRQSLPPVASSMAGVSGEVPA
jgi:amino acid adenylation domain-containing protein